jgi:hypothetical protein
LFPVLGCLGDVNVERSDVLRIAAKKLYPILREDGFRGSGSTLRRVADPLIHVFNIQGSSSADGCYINLGAHLAFLPSDGGGSCEAATIKEYQCAFRERLEPLDDSNGRWPYGRTQSEADATVEEMIKAWRNRGIPFFDRFGNYPDAFAEHVRAAVRTPPHPGHALTYARIGVHLGLAADAVAIARQAIDAAPPAATSLRAHLRRVLEPPT